ncbi:hypothetical protein XAP6164_3790005 [Xanthomonas phaseoli pv. phaseoli]|nr:hypothetical protein XAP6164_3790005 [Xanthomonas phaseoli pv. phaseoli]
MQRSHNCDGEALTLRMIHTFPQLAGHPPTGIAPAATAFSGSPTECGGRSCASNCSSR